MHDSTWGSNIGIYSLPPQANEHFGDAKDENIHNRLVIEIQNKSMDKNPMIYTSFLLVHWPDMKKAGNHTESSTALWEMELT